MKTVTAPPAAARASRPAPRQGPPGRPAALGRRLVPYAFLAPALVLFLVFVFGPMVGALVLSLFHYDLLASPEFAGTGNFTRLLEDDRLHEALGNTLVFTFWSIVLHVGLGLGLALAVNRRMWRVTRYFLRTAIFFPFLISWAAVALIWKYAYDPAFGVFTHYTRGLGIPEGVLVKEAWAMPALILTDLWHTLGFSFVVILAGLQAIPPGLYEAARIDGAGAWHRFWHITIPMLSPTLFFVTVISFIGAFQIFEPMFIMTNGGPEGSTTSVVQYLYETGFREFQVGYASAIALLVFVIVLAATLVQFRLRSRWVHER